MDTINDGDVHDCYDGHGHHDARDFRGDYDGCCDCGGWAMEGKG